MLFPPPKPNKEHKPLGWSAQGPSLYPLRSLSQQRYSSPRPAEYPNEAAYHYINPASSIVKEAARALVRGIARVSTQDIKKKKIVHTEATDDDCGRSSPLIRRRVHREPLLGSTDQLYWGEPTKSISQGH